MRARKGGTQLHFGLVKKKEKNIIQIYLAILIGLAFIIVFRSTGFFTVPFIIIVKLKQNMKCSLAVGLNLYSRYLLKGYDV